MKKIFKFYIVDTLSLYLVSLVAQGIVFKDPYKTIFIAGIFVTVISITARPVINLLLLPLNLITFGFFRWISFALVLYLVALIYPDFKITGFFFSGFQSVWIDLPSVSLALPWAYVAFSFLYALIASFFHWLSK